jgi:hypothetical protein
MNPQQQQAQMQQAQADRNRVRPKGYAVFCLADDVGGRQFRDPKALMEAFYHFDR